MKNAWKWVGLAGIVGVAAGGVLVGRDVRQRNSYTPDDIRARLHARYEQAAAEADHAAADSTEA